METVVGLFTGYEDADQAVTNLTLRGFDRSTVGVVASEATIAGRQSLATEKPLDRGEGAGEGAVLGGLAGLLVGVVALAIPGAGPLFIVGALASVVTSTVAGATAGAVTGGLLGALTDLGLPDADAKVYSEGVKAGGVIVTVNTDRGDEARGILRAANATSVSDPVALSGR